MERSNRFIFLYPVLSIQLLIVKIKSDELDYLHGIFEETKTSWLNRHYADNPHNEFSDEVMAISEMINQTEKLQTWPFTASQLFRILISVAIPITLALIENFGILDRSLLF